MDVERYIEIREVHNNAVDKAQAELNNVTQGNLTEMGLVNNETRKSMEYRIAKSNFDRTFKMSQDFAKSVPNKIKREASMLKRASWIK